MCWTYVKRFIFYGGIATIITAPVAYKWGYSNGKLECKVEQVTESRLEKVGEQQFRITNPDDNLRYIIDFKAQKLTPASTEKRLEEIFAK
ncbi:hypothetical protein HY638_05410 [Candidatus Woesearchaeota archaeon]|nr:hypothetical protein [Candidatus Woesearchaeota archaeon]